MPRRSASAPCVIRTRSPGRNRGASGSSDQAGHLALAQILDDAIGNVLGLEAGGNQADDARNASMQPASVEIDVLIAL